MPGKKNGKKYFSRISLLAAIAAAIFVFTNITAPCCAQELKKITILYTNDTHSRLIPFDRPDIGKSVGGIERRAEYFRSVKKQEPGVLIVDAGDLSQGTPFYNFFKGEAEFNSFVLAGYDLAAVGNHEFDNGLDNLKLQPEKSGLRFVCANLFDSGTLKPLFAPFKIVEIGGVKTAVIGIMGKDSWSTVSNQFKKGVLYADEIKLLERLCAMLDKSVDLIVVLSHSGHEADLRLAAALPRVDVIIGSHTHTKLDKPVIVKKMSGRTGGTAITQAFENGVYAGRLDIYLDGANRPVRYDGGLKLIDGGIRIDKRSALHASVRRYENAMKGEISRKIGVCEAEMSNFVADMFNATDHPLGRLVCDAANSASGSDVFFVNSTMLRDRLPKGDITIETAYRIIPFDNTVTVFEMKGEALLRMMDFIAANFGKNESFQYGGISFAIDLKNRAALDVKVKGAPVEADRTYKVATSSYIAQGNLMGSEMFKEASGRTEIGGNIRDMFAGYIEKTGVIKPAADERIKLIK